MRACELQLMYAYGARAHHICMHVHTTYCIIGLILSLLKTYQKVKVNKLRIIGHVQQSMRVASIHICCKIRGLLILQQKCIDDTSCQT